MQVGALVRYKKRRGYRTLISLTNPYRVAIVTMVLPSSVSVFLSEFAKDVPHKIEDLEVISESLQKK